MRISDWSSDVCSSDLNSLEQVAFVPVEELAQIEGFDEEVAEELRARARAHLEELDRHNEERRRELGVADALTEVEGLTPGMLVMLGEQGVKTLDDLADLAADELRFACSSQRGEHSLETMGKLSNGEVERILQASPMGQDEANTIIMAARAHWFDDEEPAPAAEAVAEAHD